VYGMRTGNAWDLMPLVLYLALCAGGGWGLVRGGTRLPAGDRPLVGGALGLVLAIWLANLLAGPTCLSLSGFRQSQWRRPAPWPGGSGSLRRTSASIPVHMS
jgi:hypothetical protein